MAIRIVSHLVSPTGLLGPMANQSDLVGQSFTVGETGGYLHSIVARAYGGSSGIEEHADDIYVRVREFVNDTPSSSGGALTGTLLATSSSTTAVANGAYPDSTYVFENGTTYLEPNTKYIIQFGTTGPGIHGAWYIRHGDPYDGGKAYGIDGSDINPGLEKDISFEVYVTEYNPEVTQEEVVSAILWNLRQEALGDERKPGVLVSVPQRYRD